MSDVCVTVSICPAVFFFFFSSRRRHTRCSRDWSSDVCSSDLQAKGDLLVTEPRKVPKGGLVAVGSTEDGSDGIYVHAEGFLAGRHSANEFGFMQTEVSRERPVDYAVLAQLLGEEKQRGGMIVWVVGPARSEEHTSELQSRLHLVCRLLLEKKKNNRRRWHAHQTPNQNSKEST